MGTSSRRTVAAASRPGTGFEACPGEAIAPAAGRRPAIELRAHRVPSALTAPVARFREGRAARPRATPALGARASQMETA